MNITNKEKEFCDYCGKRLALHRPTQRFCSALCKARYQRAERRKALAEYRNTHEPKPMTFACDECGKDFRPTPILQNFCSFECRQAFHGRIDRADTELEGTQQEREEASAALAAMVQPKERINRRI